LAESRLAALSADIELARRQKAWFLPAAPAGTVRYVKFFVAPG
jgi:hypothetical protein